MNDGNKSYDDYNARILEEFDHAERSKILNERFHDLPGGYRQLPLDSSNCGFCEHWDKYTGYCIVSDSFRSECEACLSFKRLTKVLELKGLTLTKGGRFKITLDDADDSLFRKD